MKIRIEKDTAIEGFPYAVYVRNSFHLGWFKNLSAAIKQKRSFLQHEEVRQQSFEDFLLTQESDDYDYDDNEPDEFDEFEEAMNDCSGFWDGDVFMCGAVGSEMCEFECRFNRDIGKTAEQIENELSHELSK